MVANVVDFQVISSGQAFALPDHGGGQLQDTFSDVGFGSITYPLNGRNASLLVPLAEVLIQVNGVEQLRFIIEDIQGDDVSDGTPSKTYSGRSTLAYLEHAIVYPSAWPAAVPANQQFILQTPGTIWRTLMLAANNRGTITNVDCTTFTGTTDSNGVPWPLDYSLTFTAGTSYLQILQQMVSNGQMEVDIVGDSLRLYVIGTFGATPKPDTIVLRATKNITEGSSHKTVSNLGTVQLVSGDNNVIVEEVGSTVATYGRIEKFTNHAGVGDAGTLNVLANADIAETDFIQNELTTAYAIQNGPIPYTDFIPGDYIWYDTNGVQSSQRVRQITMSIDANAVLSVAVTLSDLLMEKSIVLARQVQTIMGGATGVSSAPLPPAPDTVAPSPPVGVAFTSAAYLDSKSGQTFAQVSMNWQAPTTSADGNALTDLAGYLAEWHYVGDNTSTANMLTSADSTFDTSLGTWTGTGSTLTRVTTPVFAGTHSMQMSSTAGGTTQAHTGSYSLPDSTRNYQAFVQIWTTTARSANVQLHWFTSGSASISTSVGTTYITTANQWTGMNINVTPPTNAAFVQVIVNVASMGVSELCWIDSAGLLEDNWTPLGFITNTFCSFSPATPNKLIEVRVAAVDQSNNVSTFDTSAQGFTAADAIPPSQPSAPIVTSTIASLKVTWNGFDINGLPQPADFERVEVWYNTANNVNGAKLWDVLTSPTGGSTTIVGLAYNVDYYVYLIAYDISNNASPISTIVGPTDISHVNGQVGGDITQLAADVIVGGFLSAAFISLGGLLTTVSAPFGTPLTSIQTGQRVEIDSNGIRGFNSSSTSETTGVVFNFSDTTSFTIGGWTVSPTTFSGGSGTTAISLNSGTGAITGGIFQTSGNLTVGGSIQGIKITAANQDRVWLYSGWDAATFEPYIGSYQDIPPSSPSGDPFFASDMGLIIYSGAEGNGAAFIVCMAGSFEASAAIWASAPILLVGTNSTSNNVTLSASFTGGGPAGLAGSPANFLYLITSQVNSPPVVRVQDDNRFTTTWAQVSASAFNVVSSEEFKTSITDYTADSLSHINSLKPKVFYRLGREQDGIELGLIAEELKPIIPHAVTSWEAEDDEPAHSAITILPLLTSTIHAVQQLSAKVDELQTLVEKR